MVKVHCIDPSGEVRVMKLTEFPAVWGTNLNSKQMLRDPKLQAQAFEMDWVEEGNLKSGLVLKVIQTGLDVQLGDLKLQSFKVPMDVSLKVGDTELVFSTQDQIAETIEFPKGERPWYSESTSGLDLLRVLKRAAQSRLSLYLYGETGTGKEVLARLAHMWSERAQGPFIPINCGALPLSLVESELFGHVKGSFTGAVRDRPGALLQAHGGTLFLDEMGDLPPEIQVKLLRFLENGEIRPVGSDRVLHADVRVISATHKPLSKLVKSGHFRQDLYFRLASLPLEIPTLSSRPEDVESLSRMFAREFGKGLTEETIFRLKSYSWPGNVRELRHAIERACGTIGPSEPVLYSKEFDFLVYQQEENQGANEGTEVDLPGVYRLCDMEKIMLLRALKMAGGNRSEAAKILGVARSTLFEMLKRHQIIGPRSQDRTQDRAQEKISLTHTM